MADRVDAVHRFLEALGLPAANVRNFSAVVTHDRNGDHVTVTYNLAEDNPLRNGANQEERNAL